MPFFVLAWFAADSLAALVVQGDTLALMHEVDGMLAAIKAGHPMAWGGQMPLLQQIPAAVLKVAGLDSHAASKWLAVLSVAAFFGLLARVWVRLEVESRRVAAFVAAVLLSGPLLWYARTSFGEMLAAFFTVGFALRCREGTSDRLLVLEGLLAGTSKEIAIPFLLLLGASASFAGHARWRDAGFRSRRLMVLLVVAVGALIINAGFNYLRFGIALNRSLMNPLFRVSDVGEQASFFVALWFSPNGGVLFFWPSYGLLLLLAVRAAVGCWRAAADFPAKLGAAAPLAGVSVALLGLTAGFSRWAFPMGWVCWGPRFFVPWFPAFIYVIAASYARPLDALFERWSQQRWKAWCVGVGLALVSIPQFAIPFHNEIIWRFFAPDRDFPKPAIIQEDAPYYFRYIDHLLWRKESVLRDGYRALLSTPSPKTLAMIGEFLLVWALVVGRPRRAKPVGGAAEI